MQPLSYQIGTKTCWATSIINGIIFLLDGARMESVQYKILHFALNSILRKSGVVYYTNDDYLDCESVTKILEEHFSLRFHCVRGPEVQQKIREMTFKDEVAVCDVGKGDHSILLNGKSECGEWLSAFDPWWYCLAENDRVSSKIVKFPKNENSANVRINLRHLLEDPYNAYETEYGVGKAYPMGHNIEMHFLIVVERIDA